MRSSVRKRGQLLEVALELGAALGRGLGDVVLALVDEVGDLAAVAGQRRERGVGVAGEVRERAGSAGRGSSAPVELRQRRVGAADDLAELVAVAGQAGAELVDDEREALALGQPQVVADEVDADRARGVRARAAGAGPRRAGPWGSWPAAAGGCRRARRAGSACTRRTARRSATAGGSCSARPCGSPRSPGR